MSKRFMHIFVLLILFSCTPDYNQVEIIFWYGTNQTFGNIGNTQRQINIPGNIQSENNHINAYFTLNNHPTKNPLTLGCDLHRLAEPGDFNIEIERKDLTEGQNIVEVFVSENGKTISNKKITFNYSGKNKWPLPYSIDWQKIKRVQDAVEIVDGNWELTENGIKTKNMYYDRIIAFGDHNWENYEVKTSVLFHDFALPEKGPPTYNVSHAAIATRWPGHDFDTLQPNRKWFPLGATAEFRLTSEYDSCRWRIFDGEHFYNEQDNADFRKIKPNTWYSMKHRVESISENETRYSVKLWDSDKHEPLLWDFQAIEKNEKPEKGSALLIAHHTLVTFGNIEVLPIEIENIAK